MLTVDSPVGALIEDPSVLPVPRPPLMKRMCCGTRRDGERCDLVLGWVICAAELEGEVTHGVCEDCAARSLEALEDAA